MILNGIRQFLRLRKYENIDAKNARVNKKTKFEGNNKIGQRSYVSNCYFGRYSYIGEDCRLRNVKIGRYCSLGNNIKIIYGKHPLSMVGMHPFFYEQKEKVSHSAENNEAYEVQIGHDVWIGDNVSIFPGVTIGIGAVIGTNALVVKDVEPYSIVVGVPAKIKKYRFNEKIRKELLQTKWWENEKEILEYYRTMFNEPEQFIRTYNENKNKDK